MQTGLTNTVRCAPSSSRREVAEAQARHAYRIAGQPLPRVPFGGERGGTAQAAARCADCGAARGEFHVPGCEHEQCPACGGSVISCDCAYGLPEKRPSLA
jgi:hypothetical protein